MGLLGQFLGIFDLITDALLQARWLYLCIDIYIPWFCQHFGPCLNHGADKEGDCGAEEGAAEGVGDAEGGPRKVGRDVHEGGEEPGREGPVEEETDADLGGGRCSCEPRYFNKVLEPGRPIRG